MKNPLRDGQKDGNTLQKFRERLEALLLGPRLDRRVLEEAQASTQDDKSDELDRARGLEDTSLRTHLHSREARFVEKVKAALRRIEEGTFGTCDECGGTIGERRLEARPTATMCVPCKRTLEEAQLTARGLRGLRFALGH